MDNWNLFNPLSLASSLIDIEEYMPRKKRQYQVRSLEDNLLLILDKVDGRTITLETLVNSLSGRGYPLILILLSLPFCQPIQIPGFSAPFGILIALSGLRMAFHKRPWWPQWLLKKEISFKTLEKIIHKSLWLIKKIKRFVHPRLVWICYNPILQRLHGVVIAMLGIFLALPLPIPFTNLIAAWAILFIGLGLLEDDGLLVSLGYVLALACLAFFIIIGFSLAYFVRG